MSGWQITFIAVVGIVTGAVVVVFGHSEAAVTVGSNIVTGALAFAGGHAMARSYAAPGASPTPTPAPAPAEPPPLPPADGAP